MAKDQLGKKIQERRPELATRSASSRTEPERGTQRVQRRLGKIFREVTP
jgi:hypothetical protein